MPVETNARRIAFFDYKGNSITLWLSKVIDLLVASRFIDNHAIRIKRKTKRPRRGFPISVSAIDPCFMLKGFVVECYFKSIWLIQGYKLAENGQYKKIPNIRSQHNLSALSVAVRMNIFRKNEIRFLDALTHYSTGPGRYPIGISYKSKKPYIPERHIKYFRKIVQKISNELLLSPHLQKKHVSFIETIIRLVS